MSKNKKFISLVICMIIIFTGAFPTTAYSATESQIRSKIVSIASNEIGYTGSSSYSKYGEWYGYQGAWCTTFVLWCYNKAGNSLDVKLYGAVTPSGGNCNSMISWYKNKGRYHTRGDGYTPKNGDLVFFDWSGNGSSQHVGIVNYVSGSTVYTIEGNCSGKVKAREYTTSGSKPYNNVSAIMGYASPDFSGLSSSDSGSKTTKKQTTTTTTKKQTTKKQTTKNNTTSSAKTTSTTKPKTTTTTTTTTTEATTQPKKVETLTLSASTNDLKIGDTVKLNYIIEPSDTVAVVGYFCDEEGIIQIDDGGDITAIGSGTATVVVCVNDDLYSQCDFTVTEAVAEVTALTSEKVTENKTLPQIETTQKNAKSVLTSLGVNVTALSQNKKQYIIPASIVVMTLVICIAINSSKKKKKNNF